MITHGDFQTWNIENLHRSLDKIINAKSDRRTPYFILVIFKKGYNGPSPMAGNPVSKTPREKRFDEFLAREHIMDFDSLVRERVIDLEGKTVMHTRMIITDKPPVVRLIGTALWRIDNRTGEARCIYILPPDKPVMGTSFEDEKSKESSLVARSGQGMPLVYNA